MATSTAANAVTAERVALLVTSGSAALLATAVVVMVTTAVTEATGATAHNFYSFLTH